MNVKTILSRALALFLALLALYPINLLLDTMGSFAGLLISLFSGNEELIVVPFIVVYLLILIAIIFVLTFSCYCLWFGFRTAFKKFPRYVEYLYFGSLLVTILIIFWLFYAGVIYTDNPIPERCTFPAGIECYDFVIYEVEPEIIQVLIDVRNSYSNPISEIQPIILMEEEVTEEYACNQISGSIATNESFIINCTEVPGVFRGIGEKTKILVKLKYKDPEQKEAIGEILSTIQPKT